MEQMRSFGKLWLEDLQLSTRAAKATAADRAAEDPWTQARALTRHGENLVSAPICARMKVSDGGSNVSLKISTLGISSTLDGLLKVVGTEGRDYPAINFF